MLANRIVGGGSEQVPFLGSEVRKSFFLSLSHKSEKAMDLTSNNPHTHQHLNTHTSILRALIWTESHRMLRQISCGQLTTRSPIIRAIRWRMAPAAATMASMVTERIQSATIQAILWRTALAAATKELMGTARTRMTMVGQSLLGKKSDGSVVSLLFIQDTIRAVSWKPP